MSILDDIDSAAWDLEHGRIGGLYPISNNFAIVANYNTPVYSVYSYATEVARVVINKDYTLTAFVKQDAFHHSTTTSRHLRRFLSALIGQVDWNALYKACDYECDRECNIGDSEQFINVREVA